MSLMHSKLIIVLVAMVPAGICGCQRSLWHERADMRREHSHRLVSNFVQHEAEGKERIDRSLQKALKLHHYHQEHLARTAQKVEEKFARDVQNWKDDQPKREAVLRRQWDGHREKIPATWAKMVY